MHYVYIIESEVMAGQYYYGQTNDLAKRLKAHNMGQSSHTSKYRPWKITWYAAFQSPKTAVAFEKYLKTASGKAFARKRLISRSFMNES